MNNKPVAWLQPDTLECGYGGDVDWEDTGCIPLYAHPVTITDEEIDNCAYRTGMWCDGTPDSWDTDAIRNFARAILAGVTVK